MIIPDFNVCQTDYMIISDFKVCQTDYLIIPDFGRVCGSQFPTLPAIDTILAGTVIVSCIIFFIQFEYFLALFIKGKSTES